MYLSLDLHLFAEKYFEYSKDTLTLRFPRTPFFVPFSCVFKIFIYTVIRFVEKQSYILRALKMLSRSIYSGLDLNLFAEKYFEHCRCG